MRNLKFDCDCGVGQFRTLTDHLPYLAHFVPDQEYDHFSNLVDDAIEKSGPTPSDKERACMAWREYRMLRVWQCFSCGSVYIEAPDGSHHKFVPASGDVSTQLFKREG